MATSEEFQKNLDRSGFSTTGYVKKVEKPWGYELHLIADGGPYMAKIMHIKKGCRLSMQVHDAKSETYYIHKGRAGVIIENSDGDMVEIEIKPGEGYTTKLGQKHRIVGITDCDVFEASTPELGTTWRLEDDYARPDETEELRTQPNRGWDK